MAAAAAAAAATVVASVLPLISSFILEKYLAVVKVKDDLEYIKLELEHMVDFLERADLLEKCPEVKPFAGQVRDVATTIQNVLGEFRVHLNNNRAHKGFKDELGFAERIRKIKEKITLISESHGRYKIDHGSSLPQEEDEMVCNIRQRMMYLEESDLVGIQDPKKQVKDLILNRPTEHNVVSVVGPGGLGKSTVVRMVYKNISDNEFQPRVWIRVSESFKSKEIFKQAITQLSYSEKSDKSEDNVSLQEQLDKEAKLLQTLDTLDITKLKSAVQYYLKGKKYIVVLDDVWRKTDWDAIHDAFPKNKDSCIVITSRNIGLGESVSTQGNVHHLTHLSKDNARELFCKIALSSKPCPEDRANLRDDILAVCEGLPLAICVIAGVLAGKQEKYWKLFYNSLTDKMGEDRDLDVMTRCLLLSYYDLPKHLKNCMLYLSNFPEDAKILKDDLAQLWDAEGYIKKGSGMTVEDVAYNYLSELYDRCLVQVALVDIQGDVRAIRTHGIIRRTILLKSREQQVATVFEEKENDNRFVSNVKRLFVQGSINGNLENALEYCKDIQTLVLCKNAGGDISESFLSKLLSDSVKLVRVLCLNDAGLDNIPVEVFGLVLLEYLNLRNTKVVSIPNLIGRLKSLKSLNLIGTHVTELPVEMQELLLLRHLAVGSFDTNFSSKVYQQVTGAKALFRISKLKSLIELRFIEADEVDKIKIVTEIGQLLQLRVLGITKLKKEDGEALCSSLGSLKQLRKLFVYADEQQVIDLQYIECSYLPSLETLILSGHLEESPVWMPYLLGLKRVDLQCSKLRDGLLECLHDLPNLVSLYLTLAYEGKTLCFKAKKFPKLKYLFLRFLPNLTCVTVEREALPVLKLLLIRECPSMEDIPTGIENLESLGDLEFSNMSDEFVSKLENLDRQSAAYKGLLRIPRVRTATWTNGSMSASGYLDRNTGAFKTKPVSHS